MDLRKAGVATSEVDGQSAANTATSAPATRSRKRASTGPRSMTSLLAIVSAALAALVTVGSIYLHAVGLV